MSPVVDAFNHLAEDYDKWFDSDVGKVLFKLEADAIMLLIKDLEHPFLEIGVGTGRFAEVLGIEFGVDLSQEVLKIAKKRGIKVTLTAGEKLPFESGSFGGVFILFTLCFVKEPQKVINEAKRVLKAGGVLIIGIINRESSWGAAYMKKQAEGHPIYRYAKFYNVNETREMIERSGLIVDSYSSTLCQPPSKKPLSNMSFVCIKARKSKEGHYE